MEESSHPSVGLPGPSVRRPLRGEIPGGGSPPQPDATVISARPATVGRQTSVAEIGRSLEGHSLGPYRLERFVGGGGMGAVFRALDTTLNRIVAVKVLSGQQSNDDEMLKRFRNEAQSAARLDHENIGRVYAVGSDEGWHYIVFEFIEGTNLRDVVVAEGPFDLGRAINVTIQVADALEHASQRDVVHRDIKPSNIIITPAGRARVVDMGLARLHRMTGDQDLTVSGMTLGTFDYISPEQARDPRSADVRSDLYSLGCTVFYMLVGRAPFASGTMVQKLLQHQQDAPPAIETLRPDVPKRFGAILGRLMEKDPKDRYQRPADLVADLVAVADDLGIELASPRPVAAVVVEQTRSPSSVHLPWLVPLLGLIAVVGGLWLRAAGQPRRSVEALGGLRPASVPGENERSLAGGDEPAEPRVWRVVDVPTVDDDYGTVGEAVRQASDGDVIEVACEEPRDDGPFTVEGKRLTIRAAANMEPVLRFGEAAAHGGEPAFCTVESGTLELRGVTLRAAFLPMAAGRPAIIGLKGSATLDCEGVEFVIPRDPTAFAVCVRSEQAAGERQEIRMTDTDIDGGGAVVSASGGGSFDVIWSGGRVVTAGRFMLAESPPLGGQAGLAVRMTLDHGLFACGDGLVCLLDSPDRPVAPRLHVFARGCKFLDPAGRPLLEQSGIGDSENYRLAVEWIDAASRYEGSTIFRRIDGAAERVDMDFASQPQPFDHATRIEAWPGADRRPGSP